MNDWFEWNDVRCTWYRIHVSELSPLTLPSERVTYTSVPGRLSSLTILEGDEVVETLRSWLAWALRNWKSSSAASRLTRSCRKPTLARPA